jgi:hypothetical protein
MKAMDEERLRLKADSAADNAEQVKAMEKFLGVCFVAFQIAHDWLMLKDCAASTRGPRRAA